MEIAKRHLRLAFYSLGERVALIIVFLIAIPVLFLETTDYAFSQEKEVYTGFSENGLTFELTVGGEGYSYAVTMDYHQGDVRDTLSHEPHVEIVEIKDESVTPPVASEDVWEQLAQCESHANWSINTGNGYYGGLQFSEGAWRSAGGSGMPHEASREEQIERGKTLQQLRGWGAWGACAKKLGLN